MDPLTDGWTDKLSITSKVTNEFIFRCCYCWAKFSTVNVRRHWTVVATSELPAFLTSDGGLNSGFMMAHVTAAALG